MPEYDFCLLWILVLPLENYTIKTRESKIPQSIWNGKLQTNAIKAVDDAHACSAQ
jgi:hypothetical protein